MTLNRRDYAVLSIGATFGTLLAMLLVYLLGAEDPLGYDNVDFDDDDEESIL